MRLCDTYVALKHPTSGGSPYLPLLDQGDASVPRREGRSGHRGRGLGAWAARRHGRRRPTPGRRPCLRPPARDDRAARDRLLQPGARRRQGRSAPGEAPEARARERARALPVRGPDPHRRRSDAGGRLRHHLPLPAGTFAKEGAIAAFALTLENLMVGAYLGAVDGIQTPPLKVVAARIGASEAQHLAYLATIKGLASFEAFPNPLTIQQASNALDAYTA